MPKPITLRFVTRTLARRKWATNLGPDVLAYALVKAYSGRPSQLEHFARFLLVAVGFLDYCRNRTGENNPFIKGRKKSGSKVKRQNGGSLLTAFGKSQSLTEWSRESGILPGTLYARLKAGWGMEDALSRPLGKQFAGVRAYQSKQRGEKTKSDGATP